MPIGALPVDTDDDDAATFEQPYQVLLDYAAFAMKALGAFVRIREDFTGGVDAEGSGADVYPGLLRIFATVPSDMVIVQDTADGCAGVAAITPSSNAIAESVALNLTTRDLYMDWRAIGIDSGGGGGSNVFIGLKGAAAARELYFQSLTRGNWHAVVGANSPVDTGIAYDAITQHKFSIDRVNGVAYFLIDDVQVHTVAYATSLTDVKIHFRADDAPGGPNGLAVDSVDLLVLQ